MAAKLPAMRALFLALTVICLAGCTSLVRLGADGFKAGNAPPEQFASDGQACRVAADDYLSYDARAPQGTHYAKNRAFNAAFGACMKARGYRPRAYAENLLPG